jgi:membrane protease YdiL (CAAX protease family)
MIVRDHRLQTKAASVRCNVPDQGQSKWERWRINAAPPFYGVGEVLLLGLMVALVFIVVRVFHRSAGEASFRYFDSPIAVLSVVLFVFYSRPQLLALSRWRPRWLDGALGVAVGAVVPIAIYALMPDFVSRLDLHVPIVLFLIPTVVLGPIAEEILFRGIILRSFRSYFPRSAAVLLGALLVSLAHPHFWLVLPSQVAVSILYVSLGDSMPASIVAHITNNACILVLATGVVDKWRAHLWSIWK